jgi:hypothetical protein
MNIVTSDLLNRNNEVFALDAVKSSSCSLGHKEIYLIFKYNVESEDLHTQVVASYILPPPERHGETRF